MIGGVTIQSLKQIIGDRGRVMHMLKATDGNFEKFGEIYFSTVPFGAIKDWHLHKTTTLNYAVVFGLIKLVLIDQRKDSPTLAEVQEIYLGQGNYSLVTIPPGVISAFKGLFAQESILANCATEPHDDAEMSRFKPFDKSISYDWSNSN